ncbi:MFS transporter [Edaphobacillus lindanitolerans]|uniref:MFS transporter, PPP family, 3-phenylpropionic acid transporter n=1 Tax=Edaphobacillus lindanitolerans TaxID=550447 RepID=A0A1U7PSI1_9BACI|nr:MFS transporter [Edaphobacillus lindanitolerans]SIT89482.1 MFS transporter, PPP family, 3-phenylpropionic acid transporter [Edaphobacillus lindanitolerans]
MNARWLSLNFFAYFFTWGIFLPYWTGWLTTVKGLSVFEASVVMGTGMIARALSTLFFFPAAAQRYPLTKLMRISIILSLVIGLFYIPAHSFAMLLAVTLAFNTVYPNLLPAMESGASVLIQSERIDYGRSRAFGSLGYTIALLVIGGLNAVFGNAAILWTMFAGLAVFYAAQLAGPPAVLSERTAATGKSGRGSAFRQLFGMPAFLTVLGITILLQGAHASYYNYGFIYLDDLGVASFAIGLILNVAVIVEIAFFAKADKLFGSMKASTMFLIAAIGSTVRWLLIFLVPTVWMFTLTQVLHAVSFGIAHYAFIRYISGKLPRGLIAPAQGLYAALGMSLSSAFLTLLGGSLYELSPGLAFLGMTICTVPAAVIVLLTRRRFSY